MPDFAALLESRLENKKTGIRAEDQRQQARRRTAAMRCEQVRAEASDLLAGVLRPLLDDFLRVMQSPKQELLSDGRVRLV